jgi:hypothetical protein
VTGLVLLLVVWTSFALAGTGSGSTLPATNFVRGFIDAIRVNDATGACFMTTANARRDLSPLLRQAGATGGTNVCAHTTIASLYVRAAAVRPFLGGNSDMSGGTRESGSKTTVWNQLADGRYAVVVVSNHGADGFLVDSMRLQASCSTCG